MSREWNLARVHTEKQRLRRLKKDVQEMKESRFVFRIEQIKGQQRVESTEEERIFQIVLCQQNVETVQGENLRSIALGLIGTGEKIGEQKWIGHAWNDLRRNMQQYSTIRGSIDLVGRVRDVSSVKRSSYLIRSEKGQKTGIVLASVFRGLFEGFRLFRSP